MRTHLMIPDTQVAPGVPIDHLLWIGQYIVDRKPDVVVHIGDHFDLPSLSYYDKGKSSKKFQGREYKADVRAGCRALDLLMSPMLEANERQRANKKALYRPEMHYTMGNHEWRVERYVERAGEVEGLIGAFQFRDAFEAHGWTVHDFLEIVDLDGVSYSHYFYNPLSGNPWGGLILNRLKQIGHTFTQGHTQTFDYGIKYVKDRALHGLVAGACYLHDEDYKGPQGNSHWRGIVVKHQVENGEYDIMPVSLDYLCRRYAGVRLAEFQPELFA